MNNNRFSILLESLMKAANLRNISLAQELQYDVSYISKWVNGRTLPSEKGVDKILYGISRCVTNSLQGEQREQLYHNYNVFCESDLEQAIYDNLLIEYNYVKNLKTDTGSEIAPQVAYYPELTLMQFVMKMRHPVLRKVESLEVVAMLDLLAMDKNCQGVVAELQNNYNAGADRQYPGVHFSMLIDTSREQGDSLRNTELLLNMISNFSNVDFALYETKQAIGKLIFAVKEGFVISGMMTDTSHCIAVTSCEDSDISDTMYEKLKSFCRSSNRILEHFSVHDFLAENKCMKAILSENQFWLISSVTEHFLSGELLEELLEEQVREQQGEATLELIRKNYYLIRNVMDEISVKVLVYESALQNFMVSGELDLFGCRVFLSIRQRLCYFENMIEKLKRNPKIESCVFSTEYLNNFQLINTPNVFCTNTISYIRLKNHSRVEALSKISVSRMFENSFEEIWMRLHVGTTQGGWNAGDVRGLLDQYVHSLQILSKTEETEETENGKYRNSR